jgi:hypothetical protein
MKHLIRAGVIIAAIVSAVGSALGADLPLRPVASVHRASAHGASVLSALVHRTSAPGASVHSASVHRTSARGAPARISLPEPELLERQTAPAAAAVEKPVSLKPGLGVDKVEANCGGCHSLDYVQMNSRFLNAAGWEAEVVKMVNAFGAPITPADVKSIVDYLTANY